MGQVHAVARSAEHGPAKHPERKVRLLAGLGVDGDVHAGPTVKHRSRAARDPGQPNLRQVHLIHSELHDELRARGFPVSPGQMGENITTRGLPLLALPAGTLLHIGATACVEVTGLRDPCRQLDGVRPGLMAATLERLPDGVLIRKAGVMSIVRAGGDVAPGDGIEVELPCVAHRALEPV